MKTKIKKLFLIIIVTIMNFNYTYSQNANLNRTKHWYFGNHAGLDFNNGSPVADTNGQMNVWKGSAVVSDTNGNLLFYSDGIGVWNRNHQFMPHGQNIVNLSITPAEPTQVLAVQLPGSPNIYYIFNDEIVQNWDYNLVYAIVDMSQDSGRGDIISSQNFVLNHPTEKVTAVRHSNNVDMWIITSKHNTNSFYVFRLSASGLDGVPLISSIGLSSGGDDGYLKSSLDENKLASANTGEGFELLDFDKNTGIVSNPIIIFSCNNILCVG